MAENEVDPAGEDYALRPDSPALELGFKPIDTTRVGLRGARIAAPVDAKGH